MKLSLVFNKPYPYEESLQRRFLISLLFGLFIGFFLLVFQPFDIQKVVHNHKSLFILGYGLVTFIIMMITYFVFPLVFVKFYNSEKWTIKKEVIHILSNIILITLFNVIYTLLFCNTCKSFYSDWITVFIFSFFSVLIIGIFPITFMLLIYQNILLKKNIKNAEQITKNLKQTKNDDTPITIYSGNQKKVLNLKSEQLILIESNGNYINVYYNIKNNLKREIVRNTLKNTENITLQNPAFIKCHKSYIVNINKLKKVNGNAQGYKLEFDTLDFEIPVSRNLSKKVLDIITKMNLSD